MSRLSHVLIALVLSVAPAAAQTWQIDTAHSRAQFTVRHLMISDIRGDFGAVTGTVDYDGKDLATSGKINRKDFGVKYHEVMDNGGLGVADDVFIQLDVELIQRAPRTSSN